MGTLLVVLDLCGTFVFAISGATVGVQRKLDLFGVLVLAYAAGNVGGIIRDLVIGATPPPAVADWRYIAVSVAAGLITFYRYRLVDKVRSPVLLLDAAGLALFAVSGSVKALSYGLSPVAAVLLGMLTGIGGGMVRDILAGEIPSVLRSDLYAVAALAAAAIVVLGSEVDLPFTATAIVGALVCFGIRFVAIRRGWHLPVAGDEGSG